MGSPRVIRRIAGGFTLIELMIVVIIVAVLLGLAAPAFIDVIRENQIRTQASRIVSSLNLARTTAAKENVAVMVCATTDASTCSSDESDFVKGWLVYADRNSNGSLTAGELVKVYDGLPGSYFLNPKNITATITYFPDGSTSLTSDNGIIVTCPSNGDSTRAWSVIIGGLGSPRMKRPDSSWNCSS